MISQNLKKSNLKLIYIKFHSIQNESISGTIVTQIFGGGTIVSERNFLTGYYSFPTFRKSTNSYVWYFKEQEYNTDAMCQLIEYFKKESEPTIVIMFGDHNPYLGENQLAYNELGINMDVSTVEGFGNYYSTPYIIYGNPNAKKLFNKTFVGKGNEISPIFLMNELFDYIGLKGNEYTQYMSDLKKPKTVIGNVYEKENGKYISVEDSSSNKEYDIVSYYVATNFK